MAVYTVLFTPSFERKLIVPQKLKPGQNMSHPKEYTLALAENRQSIVLNGPEVHEVLILDFGEDSVVYIRHNGERKNIPEAIRSLLRPLIFPDLYKLIPPQK
jgi:hypothetical protein